MKIAIHQPNYLPWLGYFYKMAESNVFVLLDSVQYEKNGLTNRVKIKTSQGSSWLTLSAKRRLPQLIKEVKLANFQRDKEKHIRTIELNYRKAKYFNYLFPEIKEILEKDWQYLSKLNIELIKLLREKLGIKTKLEFASNYNISGKSTDLLVNLSKKFNADIYLSGRGGRKYQNEKNFKMAKIELKYLDFIYPTYHQLWGKFIPNLSIIDLLFNCGPDSLKILLRKKI